MDHIVILLYPQMMLSRPLTVANLKVVLIGRHWVLDPIDGTKGFLRGDQYAIALALLDEGKVVLGVLACPNLPLTCIAGGSQHSLPGEVGCLFFSVVGGGTYMHSLDSSSAVKVQVSSIDNPEEASFFESYEAAHSMHDLSSSIAKKLGVKAPPVRIDSQAKYGCSVQRRWGHLSAIPT
ncbi:hypothetical protein OIU79_018358 [Salix purpurea]|uniref:3'(2'),5'-bisphosphate nucleotidase n=1 Tax=Salix purpurea TaxID=77065 RepID=A0A9Q0WXW3_SALPP|nr:hypothetical protein OIU79_018358 [Salix purpurea]